MNAEALPTWAQRAITTFRQREETRKLDTLTTTDFDARLHAQDWVDPLLNLVFHVTGRRFEQSDLIYGDVLRTRYKIWLEYGNLRRPCYEEVQRYGFLALEVDGVRFGAGKIYQQPDPYHYHEPTLFWLGILHRCPTCNEWVPSRPIKTIEHLGQALEDGVGSTPDRSHEDACNFLLQKVPAGVPPQNRAAGSWRQADRTEIGRL